MEQSTVINKIKEQERTAQKIIEEAKRRASSIIQEAKFTKRQDLLKEAKSQADCETIRERLKQASGFPRV